MFPQAQNERQENSHLREESVRLSSESTMMREALRQGLCINCGGCLAMGEWASEGNDLRAENAKLKGEVITQWILIMYNLLVSNSLSCKLINYFIDVFSMHT